MSSPSLLRKTALDTPPTSDPETSPRRLPPSPPQSPNPKRAPLSTIDRLVPVLRLLHRGIAPRSDTSQSERSSDWRVFHLTCAQFTHLRARINSDQSLRRWWEDKLSFDWETPERAGGRGRFILRMPSVVHEKFTAQAEKAITHGIEELAGRLAGREHDNQAHAAAKELGKIEQGRSTTLYMHAPKLENSSQETAVSEDEEVEVRRSPDASFFHPSSDMPALVLEVSYSQQRKDLPRLAESYIVDSQHRIRCVVGVDIPYANVKRANDKSATVSLWRAATEKDEEGEDVGICQCAMDCLPFRAPDGKALDGALELNTADLLPHDVEASTSTTDKLSIPFSMFASALANAEEKPPRTRSTRTPAKFRKRKRSPEETLDDVEEKKYLRQEAAELEKDTRADGEWRARSRGRGSTDIVAERRRSLRSTAGRKTKEG